MVNGGLAGLKQRPTRLETTSLQESRTRFDLAVVGGGMAGLTAAARASRDGATVVIVERAGELGGSARYAGYLWTAPSDEVLAEVDPDGDPSLRHALVAGFADAVEWLRSLGVDLADEVTVLRYGQGRRIDTAAYVTACEKVVAGVRGEILYSALMMRCISSSRARSVTCWTAESKAP